ncbi:hypothetical protein PAXRUDRAFT_834930 [Paxillus rubicundulus Ve08.2h10]|uniref:Unplaced genomic scaffold scaffold_2065, whole genome shotgun sequence n=1 Tax=Paxillus rubicundulus Ve08.2h10 TaxID=930991 RepID=A0A0D0DAS4_9AGAM|nr:hypothetical protein PAXRUDRAFT_834930 [Paxillus rubicundulus Ve08.2h10]
MVCCHGNINNEFDVPARKVEGLIGNFRTPRDGPELHWRQLPWQRLTQEQEWLTVCCSESSPACLARSFERLAGCNTQGVHTASIPLLLLTQNLGWTPMATDQHFISVCASTVLNVLF